MTTAHDILTAAEQARVDEHVSDLATRGYVDVREFDDLAVGARVRGQAHQWPQAYSDGTGSILRIFHCPNSAWSQAQQRPDVELVVLLDEPLGGRDRLMLVADYHVIVVPQ